MTAALANNAASMLFMMAAGHALADGPLQNSEMSKGKRSPFPLWRAQCLAVHGLIHGGVVALVTGLWWLGAAETVAHASIDFVKGSGRINHAVDQALHMACKVCWCVIAIAWQFA